MAEILAFCNQKGGVGKTTSALNIAAIAASQKIKTLLIDLDPQGNATSGSGIEKSTLNSTIYHVLTGTKNVTEVIQTGCIDNFYVIPSRSELTGAEIELIDVPEREFLLQRVLDEIKQDYELIIIDCPPSLNVLTINALCASSQLIVPLQCEYYALEGLGQLVQTYELVRNNLNPSLEIGGIVLTMVDLRTKLAEQVINEVKKFFGDKVFSTHIPRSIRLSEAPSFGKPAIIYDPTGRGTKAYQSLAQEIFTRFGLNTKPVEQIQSEVTT